jgi:hypothetical protein
MAFQKGGIDEHQKKGAFTLTARSFLWLSYKKQYLCSAISREKGIRMINRNNNIER